MSVSLGLEAHLVRLQDIEEYVSQKQARMLRECRMELFPIVQNIRNLNERNMVLIDSSISSLGGSIKFLSGLFSQGPQYLENGKMKTVSSNGKLLRTEG